MTPGARGRGGVGGVEAVGDQVAPAHHHDQQGDREDDRRPGDVSRGDGHDRAGEEGIHREGQGLEPGRQEVAGSKTRGQNDAGRALARDAGDRGEPAHEGDERDRAEERADVESRRHARVSQTEGGGDDDAEDSARERPVRDGFGEEDASVQVGKGTDEAAQGPDDRHVERGIQEEAGNHEASPPPAFTLVSRDVSRPAMTVWARRAR